MEFIDAIRNIKTRFEAINFNLDKAEDLGMHKYAMFSNSDYGFDYSYDRGGVELVLRPKGELRLDIVRLVNWLKSDTEKLDYLSLGETSDKEKVDYYGDILISNFELIDAFVNSATAKDYHDFEKHISFEGAKYWSKVFTDKGKPIPDYLKRILKDNE
jgi:hypothetical protein